MRDIKGDDDTNIRDKIPRRYANTPWWRKVKRHLANLSPILHSTIYSSISNENDSIVVKIIMKTNNRTTTHLTITKRFTLTP